MFKVPEWDDGNPKQSKSFNKNVNKKRKVTSAPAAQKKPPIAATISPNKSAGKKKLTLNKSSVSIKKANPRNKKITTDIKIKMKTSPVIATNIDTDKLDEAILSAKKRKINDALRKDDVESLLFKEDKNSPVTKKLLENRKRLKDIVLNEDTVVQSNFNQRKDLNREKVRQMLESNRNKIAVKGNKLRDRMLERLKSAQFRYLNEKLYTSSGSEAKSLFQNDPTAFQTYHEGYQQQVKKWPVNPLDVIVKRIMKMPKSHTIADLGCGEAALSRRVPHAVRSFDLLATRPGVEVCDMAHTPLLTAATDVAVYCLALMGTDLTQYLVEANRILKIGGHLLIAEVESRFDNVDTFTKDVEKLGFKQKLLDKSNDVFFFMEFVKTSNPPVKKSKLPAMTLKPCLYKKR